MIRFLHGADFHLDSAFGALPAQRAAERRRESRELLFRLADYVNGHGIGLVLLAGDLFDSASPFRETGEQLSAALGRMEARVFIAPGNHDWYGPGSPWLTVDPARRQGCLTDPVLRSYWGTAYEANYARLSALIDQVAGQVLYYDGAPAGASYFAISNGMTEASENVWDTALPYLTSVDSSTDLTAQDYEVTVTLSAEQVSGALGSALGISTAGIDPSAWFGTPSYTPSGYVDSLPVCGQTVKGTALRSALGLRSACFTIQAQGDAFSITTRGYGHGVGLSQWGAKALAEQGKSWIEILAHYFPGTTLDP